MSNFSTMLSYLRKQNKLTQQELASKTGLTRSAISMYESGAREPDFETLELLADTFNVNMDILLGKSRLISDITQDSFTYAMQNECKDLTDSDKELLLSMAKQLKAARKTKDGKAD